MVMHAFRPMQLSRQRKVDLCAFKGSLVYTSSSRTARAI